MYIFTNEGKQELTNSLISNNVLTYLLNYDYMVLSLQPNDCYTDIPQTVVQNLLSVQLHSRSQFRISITLASPFLRL